MKRLLLFAFTSVACLAAWFAVSAEPGISDQPKEKKGQSMLKAVIHVNFADADRQKHGLKNIANILAAVKDKVEIEVVAHGGGISLVVKDQTKNAEEIEKLIKKGIRFVACENTMKDKSIKHQDLLPGVSTVPSGAVEIILKQQEGWSYFKP